jgi:hypothetical protein
MSVNQLYASRPTVALAAAVAACLWQAPHTSAGTALKRIHDPGRVTYSIHLTSCHARDRGQLPDPACTPGSVDPAVSQRDIGSTICRVHWTDRVRPPESQTELAKYHVAYPAYHIPARTQSELDHLVPLELGGSNDITNLWPETGKLPNPKDKVENALNHAVCDGRTTLAAAQLAIASDWQTAEARLGLAPSPSPSPSPSATSSPAPGPSPTATAPALGCRASMSNPSPPDYSTDYVNVTTAPYARVTMVAYYKTTSTSKSGQADSGGRASIGYDISGATVGYTVAVAVTVSSGGRSASCSTSFTPAS